MKTYSGKKLDLVSFPLGGIGAGMICMEGNGGFGSVSIRNRPELFNKPRMNAALTVLGDKHQSRVLEGSISDMKYYANVRGAGMGLGHTDYGLPRFTRASFTAAFPFAKVSLEDDSFPVQAKIKAWSPFIPTEEDDSSLPLAAIEYTLVNTTDEKISSVFYFNAENFIRTDANYKTLRRDRGFLFKQPDEEGKPHTASSFMVTCMEDVKVDTAFFRGGWFDTFTMQYKQISRGIMNEKPYGDTGIDKSFGASLALPFSLEPGQEKTIKIIMSWYTPSSLVESPPFMNWPPGLYSPWYTSKFKDLDSLTSYFVANYQELKDKSALFSDALFASDLPEEILDAVSANLSIIKSTTVMRQADGRLWGWEGSDDDIGSCPGSCTHVWNYAQAFPNLFPALERSLRESEFFEAQTETGRQQFRIPFPIRKVDSENLWGYPASDGQLGGIIKIYRDFKISGDLVWLQTMWPQVKQSLAFCIQEWDPDHEGIVKQPHHNTYDIEFWGPDPMITGFYLGALRAASEMALLCGDDNKLYLELCGKGRDYFENQLYNGEYFVQRAMWENLKIPFDISAEPEEVRELLEKEGPKYQYKNGCISDMLLGLWLAELAGLTDLIDEDKLTGALLSIYKYNYKPSLLGHVNTQRPGFASHRDGGLLLCSWPFDDKPSLPFVYSDEVWTGIEYQVASHLISKGFLDQGLDIVRTCRARYDGSKRNPFNEYECGNWYARAMSSYSLLWAYTGVRYDAFEKTLYYSHKNSSNYTVFLSADGGFGLVHVAGDEVTLEVLHGNIEVERIVRK